MSDCLYCHDWVHTCDCGDSDHCGEGYYPIQDKETNSVIGLVHAECVENYGLEKEKEKNG